MDSSARVLQLGEVVRFGNGKAIKPGGEGRYPVYGSNGIIGGCDEFRYENGVIIGRVGAYCGSVAYCPERFWASDNTLVVFPASEQFDTKFLFYLLTDAKLSRYAGGAAQPLVTQSVLKQVVLTVPALRLQRRIAGILSAYDELIENNQRRIGILESMARTLFREWFVDLRGLGQIADELVELETGSAPVRWKSGRLEEFLEVLETGNRPKGGVAEFSEGVPSIGAESIIGIGQFDFSKTKYVPRDYFASMRSGIVEDRDVLVYKDGGRPGNFTPHVTLFGSGFPFDEMAINSHVYRLRARRGISQDYLYFYLSSEAVLHWMHMHGTGVAIPSLARNDLRQLPFVEPDAETLGRFDNFAQPLTSQILVLALQTRNLRQARDLLMPRLLSGQIAIEVSGA